MNALMVICLFVYNGLLVAGTAYLVGWCGWSPWWFLFPLGVMMSAKAGK